MDDVGEGGGLVTEVMTFDERGGRDAGVMIFGRVVDEDSSPEREGDGVVLWTPLKCKK